MATPFSKIFGAFYIALVSLLLLVIALFIGQFVQIQLRLSRNGSVVHHLVEALETRFPGAEFGGSASYEREVISIFVRNRLDDSKRQEVETWLRKEKIEQKITPQIRLHFDQDLEDNDIIIK